jgi:hypothetical protein
MTCMIFVRSTNYHDEKSPRSQLLGVHHEAGDEYLEDESHRSRLSPKLNTNSAFDNVMSFYDETKHYANSVAQRRKSHYCYTGIAQGVHATLSRTSSAALVAIAWALGSTKRGATFRAV